MDALVDVARQDNDSKAREDARRLLRERNLSLLLAVAEDDDIYTPGDEKA